MIPVTYKMVDLDGLDLAEINGGEVPGIYNKIAAAYNTSRFAIMCNWFFAGIVIAPAHVLISQIENGFLINDLISVKSDDTVEVLGLVPPEPVLVSLNATENGEYLPGEGEDGFSQVNVAVPVPSPSDADPLVDGAASPGVSTEWSRGDHVHPTDTSRAAASDIRFTMYTNISQLGFATKPTTVQLVNAMLDNSIFIGKGDDSISDVPAVSWGTLFIVKTVTNRWFAKWVSQNVANNQYYEYGKSGANNQTTDWKTIYSGV